MSWNTTNPFQNVGLTIIGPTGSQGPTGTAGSTGATGPAGTSSGANAPVYVSNPLGALGTFQMTKNTTYYVLNPSGYYLTMRLPLSNRTDGDWNEIIPMVQGGAFQLTIGYNSSNGLGTTAGNTYRCVFNNGQWYIMNYATAGFYVL